MSSITVHDLGDGNMILRTPNATISIHVGKDSLGYDLTSVAFVPDDPFTTDDLPTAPGSASVFTLHPETAMDGEN